MANNFQELLIKIATDLPDNNTGLISASKLRGVLNDLVYFYRGKKILKYATPSELPTTGSRDVVYYILNSGNPYLMYWDGLYINSSTRVDFPKCVSDSTYDYYAKLSDVDIAKYDALDVPRFIIVINDSTNDNITTLYQYIDGIINWIVSQEI